MDVVAAELTRVDEAAPDSFSSGLVAAALEKVHFSPSSRKRRGRKSLNATPTSSLISCAANTDSGKPVCSLCRHPADDESLYGKFLTNAAIPATGGEDASVLNDGLDTNHRHRIDGSENNGEVNAPVTPSTAPDPRNVSVHVNCALFASGLSQTLQEDDPSSLHGFAPKDVLAESRRARRLQCAYCKAKGASVGCGVEKCKRSYHLPCCVADGGVQLHFGTFPAYCARHRPKQTAAPVASSQDGASPSPIPCAICVEDVIPSAEVYDSLWMSCCKLPSNWLHRSCLQRMAFSAGRYFFKCPLCADKKIFQKEMLKMGVCVPVRDALWETSNAFDDLYQRPHCSAEICLKVEEAGGEETCESEETEAADLADPRFVNTLDSRFELMNCDVCGSRSTHLACNGLTGPLDDWACQDCVGILKEANIEAPSGKSMLHALDDVEEKDEAAEVAKEIVVDEELRSDGEESDSDPEVERNTTKTRFDCKSPGDTPRSRKRGGPRGRKLGCEGDGRSLASSPELSLENWLKKSSTAATAASAAGKQATLDSWFSAALDNATNSGAVKPKLKKIRFVYEIENEAADPRSSAEGATKERLQSRDGDTFELSVDVKKVKRGRKRKREEEEEEEENEDIDEIDDQTRSSSGKSTLKKGFFWILVGRRRGNVIVARRQYGPKERDNYVRARIGLEECVTGKRAQIDVSREEVEELLSREEERRKAKKLAEERQRREELESIDEKANDVVTMKDDIKYAAVNDGEEKENVGANPTSSGGDRNESMADTKQTCGDTLGDVLPAAKPKFSLLSWLKGAK